MTYTPIPEIVIRGGTTKLRQKVIRAAVWMLFDQLGNRVAPKIIVEIDLVKALIHDESDYGDCHAADSVRSHRPRFFHIRIDADLELPVLLETLAHEVVHLRQYAKDQLYEYINGDSRYQSTDTTNPSGSEMGSFRIKRGGSWYSTAKLSRVSSRSSFDPEGVLDDLGFRIARALSKS